MIDSQPDPLELKRTTCDALSTEKGLKSPVRFVTFYCDNVLPPLPSPPCILTPIVTLTEASKNLKAGASQFGQTVNPSSLSCNMWGELASTQFCWFGTRWPGFFASERLGRPWISNSGIGAIFRKDLTFRCPHHWFVISKKWRVEFDRWPLTWRNAARYTLCTHTHATHARMSACCW